MEFTGMSSKKWVGALLERAHPTSIKEVFTISKINGVLLTLDGRY